jgi:hypothetical protein
MSCVRYSDFANDELRLAYSVLLDVNGRITPEWAADTIDEAAECAWALYERHARSLRVMVRGPGYKHDIMPQNGPRWPRIDHAGALKDVASVDRLTATKRSENDLMV